MSSQSQNKEDKLKTIVSSYAQAVKENSGKISDPQMLNYEKQIINHFDEVVDIEDFYNIPIGFILPIVSKIEFSSLSNSSTLMKQLIKNTIKAHKNEKETILLMTHINAENTNFTLDQCIEIISSFSNSSLCTELGNIYSQNREGDVEVDYEYVLNKKEKEIGELKSQIIKQEKEADTIQFPPILLPEVKRPTGYVHDLNSAIADNDLGMVRYYIEVQHVDPNQTYGSSLPLDIACRDGVFSIVRYLIEKGARLDMKSYSSYYDNNFEMPIHAACGNGNLSILQYIFQLYPQLIELPDSRGQTPIFHVFNSNLNQNSYHQLDVIKYLIEKVHASPSVVDNEGNTILHKAAYSSSLVVVKYLIENTKMDPNTKGRFGRNALHYACYGKQIPVITYLAEQFQMCVESKDNNGQTPLFYLMSCGSMNIIKDFVEKWHANVNAHEYDGRTPLHHAAYNDSIDVVRYLLLHGADKTIRDSNGKRPFDMASNRQVKSLLA